VSKNIEGNFYHTNIFENKSLSVAVNSATDYINNNSKATLVSLSPSYNSRDREYAVVLVYTME